MKMIGEYFRMRLKIRPYELNVSSMNYNGASIIVAQLCPSSDLSDSHYIFNL